MYQQYIRKLFHLFFACNIIIAASGQKWEAVPLVSQKILNNGFTGGEGCQVVLAIECDHNEGRFLLMGTDVGGIYRSTDGGKNWEPCNVGYHPRGNSGFAIDPKNNQRALAVGANSTTNLSHGLYLTTNQGASWKHVLQIGNYDGYRSFKDKVEFVTGSFDAATGFCKTAYWSCPSGGIYKSEDGGATWKKVNNPFGDCILKVNPDSGFVYVANNSGFYKSTDGGVTFKQTSALDIRDMDVVVTAPNVVYFATSGAIYKSIDSGETFKKITPQAFPANVVTLNVSPADTSFMVVCNKVNDWGGPIYWSNDGAKTWRLATRSNENAFMPYNDRTQKFAWHPVNKNKVWALGGDWISSSTDGGKNFAWDANGYTGILAGGFFNFNIFNPELLYVASQDYNGAFTRNNGKSWIYCNASNLGWGGFTYGAYAASENVLVTQNSPGWAQDGKLTISRNGGITFSNTNLTCTGLDVGCGDAKDPDVVYFSNFVSHDLGKTWKEMKGCKGVLTASLYGQEEVYGAYNNDVVKSADKGITWIKVVTLPASVADIGIDHNNNRLFIVTSGNRLFQFENEKLTEITSRIPSDQNGAKLITTVAVDPVNPMVVYTAGAANVYKTDASVKQSTDGGKTWKIITPNLRTNNGAVTGDGANEVFAMRVNPGTRELWAAGGCYGIWKFTPEDRTIFRLVSPKADTSMIAPDSIIFETESRQNSYPLQKVQLFNGDSLVAEDSTAPFRFTLKQIAAGNYQFQAVAYDINGNRYFSQKVNITVTLSALPKISIISPKTGSEFNFGQTIGFGVETSDPDGFITKVEFFNDTVKLGEVTEKPFAFFWNNSNPGFFSIYAQATDNSGQSVVSEKITIIVKNQTGEIVYSEDFEDGVGQDWLPVSGTWSIMNNQYRNSSSNGIDISIYHRNNFYNYMYSAKVKSDWDNNAGLIFNYTDENNYYLLETDANPKTAYLKKRINGVETTLATAPYQGGGAGVYITIGIKNDGRFTTVTINGAEIFSAVSTPELASGKIGLYSWWQPAWFDDIEVRAKSTVTSTGKISTNHGNNLIVYPNPASGEWLNVKSPFNGLETIQWAISDVSGRRVSWGLTNEKDFKILVTTLQRPGIYILKLYSVKEAFQQKFVVF